MAYLIPDEALSPALFHARFKGSLPDHLGIEVEETTRERFVLSLDVVAHHMAPNGFMHAGTVVTLADTAAGFSTFANLREGQGFTTLELKSNFFSTVKAGRIRAVTAPIHVGRTTQVWDATVEAVETGKRLALFRCTQLVLT